LSLIINVKNYPAHFGDFEQKCTFLKVFFLSLSQIWCEKREICTKNWCVKNYDLFA